MLEKHLVSKDLWERVQLLTQGTSLTKQERKCKLYDAFDKFAHIKGESLYQYYLRFTQLINDMNIYKMKLEQFQVNTKFLNNLPPEWSMFVTDVKLLRDLHTTNFDPLNAYLKQHELHANEVCIMRERNQDPLALVANHQMTPSHFNTYQSSYNNPQFQQQFSPSQSPQYGSIHPTQHYSTTYPSTPCAITYPSASYPNAYSSTVHQDACPQPQSIPQIEYNVSTRNQQTHLSEFPQIDSGLAVPVFKQGDNPIDAINKMMSFLSTVVTSRFLTTNNQLRNSSNPRQQATIHDGRVTVQLVQGRQSSFAAGTFRTRANISGTGRNNSGQQRVVKCFNCQGEAQGSGKVLNEDEFEFFVDTRVVEGLVTQTVITHNAAYEVDDLDAYDSDCDDFSTAKAVLMANFSSYGSDVLSEFADFEKEINSPKQTLSKQLKEKELLTETFNVLKNESKEKETKNIDKEISLEKKVQELDNIKAQQIRPILYDGSVIAKKTNVILIVDSEETLMLEEECRSKMLLKQSDPMVLEKKVNIKPINYTELNRLSEDFDKCFILQQELSDEQDFRLQTSHPNTDQYASSPVKIEAPRELPKVSLVNTSLKKLKYHLGQFDNVVKKRITPNALTEGEWGLFVVDGLNGTKRGSEEWCLSEIIVMGEPLSPDRVFDFPMDKPHPAYDYFALAPLPRAQTRKASQSSPTSFQGFHSSFKDENPKKYISVSQQSPSLNNHEAASQITTIIILVLSTAKTTNPSVLAAVDSMNKDSS
ncbi:hypothetical protein Tco_0302629 [Tanacetum coccineum]